MANPRKPSSMKVIAGTDRADRAPPADEPKFDQVVEFPAPPQHLNPDGVAMWKDLGPQLTRAGVLQTVDLYPLEQLCYAWQRHRKKQKADMEITASEDNALLSLFSSFGLGPASRRRVMAKIADAPPANRFAKNGRRSA